MERIERVGKDHTPSRPRALRLRVAALVVGDAEVIGGSRRVARRDAGPSLREGAASGEVLVRDLLEGRAGSELHRHLPLAVPPPEARDLGVVAVENAGLRERRCRRDTAPVAVKVVTL